MDQFKETVYEDKPIEMEGMYRLLQIDAWAEPEGGWTWNQWWKIEENIYFQSPSTRLVLRKLREWDYLSKESIGKLEVEYDGYNYVIQRRNNQEPVLALEPQWQV